MPFKVPTLEELKALARSTVVNAVNKGGATKRRRLEEALGSAIGAIQYLGIERLLIVWDQLWPDTALGRWLDRHGEIWGVPRKDRAFAKGKVKLIGVDGSQLAAGSEIEATNADGETVTFVTDANTQVAGTEAFVNVTATVAGLASNIAVGTAVALTVGQPGFGGDGEVVVGDLGEDGIIGGLDLEEDEDYRARILFRIANPPQGGSAEDYESWALEVGGITRAWVVPKINGPGTVGVFVVDDNADPITPSPAKIAEVLAYLEPPDGKAPVTDDVTVGAPELLAIDIEITLSPNTAAVQAAVIDSLEEFFARRDLGKFEPKVHLSQLSEAISLADGEVWHEITSPAVSPDVGEYEIPVLGTPTFNPPP